MATLFRFSESYLRVLQVIELFHFFFSGNLLLLILLLDNAKSIFYIFISHIKHIQDIGFPNLLKHQDGWVALARFSNLLLIIASTEKTSVQVTAYCSVIFRNYRWQLWMTETHACVVGSMKGQFYFQCSNYLSYIHSTELEQIAVA